MAQTLSGLSEIAKIKLSESFEQDPKADKNALVDSILVELTPSDVSEILQLASLNPELLDQSVIDAIGQNVHGVIKNALQEELVIIQEEMTVKQAELDAKQAEIDAQKAALEEQSSNLNDLQQAIENIGQ